MIIREISEVEYNTFVGTYPFSSIYQTVEYAAVMKKQGYNYLFLGAFINDKIVAAALLLIQKIKGYNYAYIPRGFLIDYNNKELLINFTKEVK
jgi:peptidoglycan pentaglycine glycine transferase (the first glycine)